MCATHAEGRQERPTRLAGTGRLLARLLVVVVHGNAVPCAVVAPAEALRALGALDCGRATEVNNQCAAASAGE